jgi:hypothetical protein
VKLSFAKENIVRYVKVARKRKENLLRGLLKDECGTKRLLYR